MHKGAPAGLAPPETGKHVHYWRGQLQRESNPSACGMHERKADGCTRDRARYRWHHPWEPSLYLW